MTRRVAVVGVPVAVVLILVAVWLVVVRDWGAAPRDPADDPLLAPHLSGPGTALADDFTVADGSRLLGPVVRIDGHPERRGGESWEAVIVVTGDDVLGVWNAYLSQVAKRFPDQKHSPRGDGCGVDEVDGFGCELWHEGAIAKGKYAYTYLTLGSAPGDVTGAYLLHLSMTHLRKKPDPFDTVFEPFTGDVPAPEPARPRPRVVEQLADTRTGYGDEDFPLLAGGQLLAQYGTGSVTGGFDVILLVDEGADVDQVAAGYVTQGTFTDDRETMKVVSRHVDDVVTMYLPSDEAGGYTAEIVSVDRPDGPDYILFELSND